MWSVALTSEYMYCSTKIKNESITSFNVMIYYIINAENIEKCKI